MPRINRPPEPEVFYSPLINAWQDDGPETARDVIWANLWDSYWHARRKEPWHEWAGPAFAVALKNHDGVAAGELIDRLTREGYDYAAERFRSIWMTKFGEAYYTCSVCHTTRHQSRFMEDYLHHNICDHCVHDRPEEVRWSEVHTCWVQLANAIAIYSSINSYTRGEAPVEWAARGRTMPTDRYHINRSHNVWIKGIADFRQTYAQYFEVFEPLPYHSSKHVVGHIPSIYDDEKPRLLMGFELECAAVNGSAKREAVKALRAFRDKVNTAKPYFECESDSSIGDYGFEIVSSYTGLDVHEQLAQAMLALPEIKNLRSHDTTSCGLHVHIDKSQLSVFHASKLISFVNDPANLPLIVTLARRTPQECARYAAFADKKKIYGWSKEHYGKVVNAADATQSMTGRYEAINAGNARTLEFRLYRGTLRFHTLMACLEFTRASWLFARDASVQGLTTAAFLEFISRPEQHLETRYLRRRLRRNGFDVKYSPREITYLLSEINNMRKAA